MRFYLENKELGKLIQTYYEPIDNEELISLNLNKFKDYSSKRFGNYKKNKDICNIF